MKHPQKAAKKSIATVVIAPELELVPYKLHPKYSMYYKKRDHSYGNILYFRFKFI